MQPSRITYIPVSLKDNPLANHPMGMSPVEARVFAWALHSLLLNKKQDSLFVIPLNMVTPYEADSGYDEALKQGCINLIQRQIDLLPPEAATEDLDLSKIFSTISISHKKGMISGLFSPAVIPKLLTFQGKSVPDVQTLMQLKSNYAHRLFWAFQHYLPKGEAEMNLDDVRDLVFSETGVKTYPLFGDFKRSILEPSLKEINDLQWLVSYKEVKQGKKVVALHFTIPTAPVTPLVEKL